MRVFSFRAKMRFLVKSLSYISYFNLLTCGFVCFILSNMLTAGIIWKQNSYPVISFIKIQILIFFCYFLNLRSFAQTKKIYDSFFILFLFDSKQFWNFCPLLKVQISKFVIFSPPLITVDKRLTFYLLTVIMPHLFIRYLRGLSIVKNYLKMQIKAYFSNARNLKMKQ